MISEQYKKVLTSVHAKTKFGKRRKLPDLLAEYIQEHQPATILDFGCGKGNLVETLKEQYPFRTVYGFDPANPKYDTTLRKVDMIISTDVMEHIEPDLLDITMQEIAEHSTHIFHLISCAPAKLILPDGRNAHLIQETPDWWKKKHIDLGYKILKERYVEIEKFSKQLNKKLPVKNYYILAKRENNG